MSPPSANVDPISARREAVQRLLEGRIDYERARMVPYREREFKLQRMRELLARVGNPEQTLPVVHVAGTKGKGSTAAMVGAVLSAAGCRTGVFTSPHIEQLEERLAVDGQACSPAELVDLVDGLMPAVQVMDRAASQGEPDEIGPTYFEITTAMAMLHFVRRRVDAAVLEVGLGGRLDSTNVCHPRVSVITSISFDHTRQLGNTLESIAREKAGIVKPGIPVVSGVVEQEPREVIRGVCRERGCRLTELDIDFDYRYDPPHGLESAPASGKLDFHYRASGREFGHTGLSLGLLGHHQAANAAVALATLAELEHAGWKIPEDAIRQGLANLAFPARVELVSRRPAVVVDGAHNAASIDALVQVLDESFAVKRRLLVFATTEEKDVRTMLKRLLHRFDEVVFTRYLNNPRAMSPEQLDAIAAELTGRHYYMCPDPAGAWNKIRSLASPEDLICVTGSFFIAGEMRAQCTRLRTV